MLRRAAMAWLLAAQAAVYSPRAAEGGSSLEIKNEVFWDRNEVWNITPAFLLKLALSRKWTLGWDQELDVVSGASRRAGSERTGSTGDREIDAVSGASKIEMRHSENPSLTYAHRGTSVSASLYSSRESDYRSLAPAASVSRDFNDRNTTLAASWAEFFDDFRPLGAYAGEGGRKRIRSLGASVTQSLTPLTLVGLSGTWVKSWGYLGHPYNPPMDGDGVLLTEVLPQRKDAGALAAQIVQGYRLGGRLGSVNLDMRRYQDEWSLESITADLKVSQYLAEGLYLRLRGRFYRQTGAFFAKEVYTGGETYRTADIRFYPFSSYLAGAKLSGPFPESWENLGFLPDRWDVKYDHTLRDTKGDKDPAPGEPRSHRYQLYGPDENYLQGVFMIGMLFNL